MGAQGTQGTQGTQGAQGIQGTQGTQGLQGITGAQGISGASILGTANTWTNTNAFTSLSASGLTTLGGNGIGVTPAGILNISDLNDSTVRLWRSTVEYIQFAAARGGITGQNNTFLLDIVGNPNLRPFKIRQSSNGGSSFTDAVVLDTTGNVGIGTASPAAKLHVNNGEIYVQNTDYGRVMFVRGSTNIWAVGPRNTDDLYIRREGGSANVIFDGGNVGIGTSSIAAKLVVLRSDGDTVAAFTRTGGANCYITMTSGASSDYTYEMATERTGASTGNFYFGGNHSTTFKWRQGGYAQLMNLDTTGLTVTGAITNTNTTTSTSSYTNNSLAFIAGSAASSATYIASSISASHSGASGANLSGSLIGLRVTAAENWGSTTNAFAIQSQLTNTLNFQTITNGYNFHANSPSLVANSYLTNAYGLYIAQQKVTGVTTGYGIYQANSADVNYFNGTVGIGALPGSNAKLTLTGAIGINASSFTADASLHIATIYGGNGRLTQMHPTGNSLNALNLMASTNGSGTAQWWSWGVNANQWTINPGTSFGTGFTINSSGDIGVGTASPATKLDVIGGVAFGVGSTTGFSVTLREYTTGAARNWGIRDDSGVNRLRFARGSTDQAFWDVLKVAASDQTADQFWYTNGAQRMQLSSAGLAVTGALSCTGALSKGSGSFRIEHPLPEKSATHQLVHSFIEGPQADLIYRGKVVLVDGKASVNIDSAATMTEGTFEVLCRDVQCFTTNESGWTAVRGKVTGNILTIEAKDADCSDEISWMVIGERKDKHMMDTEWTDENGKVIVEPLKPIIEPVTPIEV
jgi:hypothetical protein